MCECSARAAIFNSGWHQQTVAAGMHTIQKQSLLSLQFSSIVVRCLGCFKFTAHYECAMRDKLCPQGLDVQSAPNTPLSLQQRCTAPASQLAGCRGMAAMSYYCMAHKIHTGNVVHCLSLPHYLRMDHMPEFDCAVGFAGAGLPAGAPNAPNPPPNPVFC